MEITRRIVFHSGHMLKDDVSKCHHPHGHEYVLECTLKGKVQSEGVDNGMVMNFGDLKAIMMETIHDAFDHKFIVDYQDPRMEKFIHAVGKEGVHVVGFAPTAENLAIYFHLCMWEAIERKWLLRQNESFKLKVKLQETYQCWVEYDGNN